MMILLWFVVNIAVLVHSLEVDIIPCLEAHNAKRRFHGVPELNWDAELAAGAAAWASHLSQNNILHISNANGEYGENLYTMTGYGTVGTCEKAVEYW
ncbi:Ectin [Exaiptasia diaphana]|nr:Ectin [Exaiptasia diaphana]